MPPDLTISIISANNLDLLLPCLRSVFEQTHQIRLEVYVVDNASTDNTAAAVQAEFPQVQVIKNDSRLGFSTNNNLVLERGQGRYLLLLNDDTLILDNALDKLVNFADNQRDAAVVGAYLLNPDYSDQQSYASFPHPLIEPLFSATSLATKQTISLEPFEVDIVSGACLMVRRSVLETVGPLDAAFDPIYSEEFDWCYRIKKAGYKIYMLPQAKVIHYGSYTMNKEMAKKVELLYSHKALYFRKHHGTIAVMAYKLLLTLTSLGRAVVFKLFSLNGNVELDDKAALFWGLTKKAPFL